MKYTLAALPLLATGVMAHPGHDHASWTAPLLHALWAAPAVVAAIFAVVFAVKWLRNKK